MTAYTPAMVNVSPAFRFSVPVLAAVTVMVDEEAQPVVKKPVAVVVARPVTMTITPLAQAINENANANANTTMIHRNEANVFPSLNKVQAKEHLNRIKTRLTNGGITGPKSKGDKSRLFSLLNTIVKEMVFEDDLWDDYIDSIAELIDCSSAKNTSIIKDANKLQDYL